MDNNRIPRQAFEAKRSMNKRNTILALLLIVTAIGLAIGAAHAGKRIQLNSPASFPVDI